MAITITWDQAQDASCTIARNSQERMVRCGIVRGLTPENTTAPKALGDAIRAAVLNDGGIPETYPHPDFETAVLAYVTAQAHPQNATMAKIWAGYEPIAFSGSPIDRFAVEDSTFLVNEPTQLMPGTFAPLKVSFTVDVPPAAPTNQDARFRVLSVNYPRNYRAIVLNGLFTSKPSSSMRRAANRVNDRYWQGLPIGYWRCEGPKVRWGSSTGLYSVSVPFLSRGEDAGDDWSTYEIARDPSSDKFFIVSDLIMPDLIAQDYAYGVRKNTQAVLKVGLYKTSNFNVVFDPLIDDTPLASNGGFANLVGGGF